MLVGVSAALRGALYRYVLRRLDETERLIEAEYFIEMGHSSVYVATNDIIRRSRVWPWLARLALQWKANKREGLI